jgi:hypothetical protein
MGDEEERNEEGFRAALDGLKKVGAGGTFASATAPTSRNNCAPVAEQVYAHGLQPCDHSGRPGPSPGWGTTFSPTRKLCDTTLLWQKLPNPNEKSSNVDLKKNSS